MNNKNRLSANERLIRVAAVMLAAAVVGVCLAIARISSLSARVAVLTLSGLLVFLGGFLIILVALANHHQKHKRNYFLYDKRKRADIDASELEIDRVRARVVDYMSLFKNGKKIYIGEMFESMPSNMEKMKPLLCYELLCELSECGEDACAIFLGYGVDCERIFTRYLLECSDTEMASRISQFFGGFASDRTQAVALLEYISSEKGYIEQKMLQYTRDNINSFIV